MLKTLAVWLIVLITNLDEILSKPCVDLATKHLTMLIISLEVVGVKNIELIMALGRNSMKLPSGTISLFASDPRLLKKLFRSSAKHSFKFRRTMYITTKTHVY